MLRIHLFIFLLIFYTKLIILNKIFFLQSLQQGCNSKCKLLYTKRNDIKNSIQKKKCFTHRLKVMSQKTKIYRPSTKMFFIVESRASPSDITTKYIAHAGSFPKTNKNIYKTVSSALRRFGKKIKFHPHFVAHSRCYRTVDFIVIQNRCFSIYFV